MLHTKHDTHATQNHDYSDGETDTDLKNKVSKLSWVFLYIVARVKVI